MHSSRKPGNRRRAAYAAAVVIALAGCSSLTHQSEWLDGRQGHVRDREFQYALPRAFIGVTATNTGKEITISDPVSIMAPDRQARYAVRLEPSVIAHDKYKLTIQNGLLTTVKSDNFDKSYDIAQTVVKIAAEGLKVISGLRSEGGQQRAAERASWVKDSLLLDPFGDPPAVGCGRGRRSFARGCLSGLQVHATELDGSPLPTYSREQLEALARQCESSLCSRLLRPIRVSVRLGGLAASDHVMIVPDPGLVVGHDIRRGPCIQRVTTLTFSSGVLVDYELDKPSEVLECLKVPLVMLEEIAKIPASLLTLKVQYIESENKLLAGQKTQLESALALMQAQANFAAAAAAASSTRPASGAAAPPPRTDLGNQGLANAQIEEARRACDRTAASATCLQNYQACTKRSSHASCMSTLLP